MIRKTKDTLMLKKPAYTGIYIPELSKVLMYKFQYDYNNNKYDNKLTLCFTDKSSLMYKIKNRDVYEEFK